MSCLPRYWERASGKQSQAASSIGRSRGRTSGPKRPVKKKVRGGGSAFADAASAEAPEDDLVVPLSCPGSRSCPIYKPLHPLWPPPRLPYLQVSRESSPHFPSHQPNACCVYRERTAPPPPPAPTLASLAHSVSRDLLTPSLFSRESISAKSASKLWLPKPATPLPAPLLEAPPPAPPSSRPPLRRAPAPASSWGWTQEPEGRARAPSALLRARCHLGREWGRARTGPEAESH